MAPAVGGDGRRLPLLHSSLSGYAIVLAAHKPSLARLLARRPDVRRR
jgi:hypothetical protein